MENVLAYMGSASKDGRSRRHAVNVFLIGKQFNSSQNPPNSGVVFK